MPSARQFGIRNGLAFAGEDTADGDGAAGEEGDHGVLAIGRGKVYILDV